MKNDFGFCFFSFILFHCPIIIIIIFLNSRKRCWCCFGNWTILTSLSYTSIHSNHVRRHAWMWWNNFLLWGNKTQNNINLSQLILIISNVIVRVMIDTNLFVFFGVRRTSFWLDKMVIWCWKRNCTENWSNCIDRLNGSFFALNPSNHVSKNQKRKRKRKRKLNKKQRAVVTSLSLSLVFFSKFESIRNVFVSINR
jgi:hypothetical protein